MKTITYSNPKLTTKYINNVWSTLPNFVQPTLFLKSEKLSQKFNCDITIATETFQYTGSFKFRGAYNLLSNIPANNVVVTSSGNFGQGIAYASKLLNKKCTVIMDSTTPAIKINAIKYYDGLVELYDSKKMTRKQKVKEYLDKNPDAFFSNSYEDYRIISGNSTLGKEIFEHENFDIVLTPIGGGGLVSGMILARDIKQSKAEIIGVEPTAGNDAARSLQSGELLSNKETPNTIADGVRTLQIGEFNWEIMKKGMKEVIEVPDNLTIEALQLYFSILNLKVEPTGSLSLGALLVNSKRFEGKKVCCIVSGGNVDPNTYAQALLS